MELVLVTALDENEETLFIQICPDCESLYIEGPVDKDDPVLAD